LFTFTGNELEINALADHGEILAEILDENDIPFPGFSRNDCIPFSDDLVHGIIQWKGRQLNKLQDKPIRLRFIIRMARLFAFKFN
jgi:hypothetical protein